MKRFFFVAASVMLLSFTSVISVQEPLESKTIYVNDDGSADFNSIKEAVDNARSGDTIFVYSGIYNEHILINKTVFLYGEDKSNTFILSVEEESIISVVDVDNVEIHGFTIQNNLGYSEYIAAIHLKNASETVIVENDISMCYDGILIQSNDNRIMNNHIYENKNGISFGHYRGKPSDYKDCSILINGFSHINNYITRNVLKNNTETGIDLSFSKNNTIFMNNISQNRFGIRLRECKYINVASNNFISNKIQAFSLDEISNNYCMNYWDDWIGLKRDIFSIFPYWVPGMPIPSFDWNPVPEPYPIGGK